MSLSLLLWVSMALSANGQTKLTMPSEWTTDFKIRVYSGGGMINESYQSTFYRDSCVYEKRAGSDKTRRCIRLKSRQRTEILKKLNELRVGDIRSKPVHTRMDAGNTSICFSKSNEEVCLTDGASEEVYEDDQTNFSAAYQYLMGYAERGK